MHKIINYCDGGLCNRLLPLSSCFAYSKAAQRSLAMCWPINNVCEARFEDLFDNEIESYSFDDFIEIQNARVFSNFEDIEYIRRLRSRKMFNNCIITGNKDIMDINCKEELAILYNNTLVPSTDEKIAVEFIKNLRPKTDLQEKIQYFKSRTGLDKSFAGVHARLTDYPVGYRLYETQLHDFINKGDFSKIFLCSDDPLFEKMIVNKYPGIITREKNVYITKYNNNYVRSPEYVKEGLIDLYLLSMVNLKIFNPASSYAKTAILLGS